MSLRPSSIFIYELEANQIFVFGSNEAGIHGAGAARQAIGFGAKHGQGIGLVGQTYGIPTKDSLIQTLPLEKILSYVSDFIKFATIRLDLEFLVTEIGCGLAGYRSTDIAPMFKSALLLPNVCLPRNFLLLLT